LKAIIVDLVTQQKTRWDIQYIHIFKAKAGLFVSLLIKHIFPRSRYACKSSDFKALPFSSSLPSLPVGSLDLTTRGTWGLI